VHREHHSRAKVQTIRGQKISRALRIYHARPFTRLAIEEDALKLAARDMLWWKAQAQTQGRIIDALCDRLNLDGKRKRDTLTKLRQEFERPA
jgi:hypothetical protein